MNSPDIVIETRDLTKIFPARRGLLGRSDVSKEKIAVSGVNLQLSQGEVFGLVGPNGAGKTTLIRVLSTLLIPNSGSATVGGYDVVKHDRKVRRLVGLVASNERSFYWRLTGRQNLAFFADLYHIPREEGRKWLEELYDALDLRAIIDLRFDHYSTGQKQRLAIARGLLSKPKILLMDEPTKGVDPMGAIKLVNLIRERLVQLWHPTILITSHNLSEIERLCGRIALMDHGKIVALGDLEELRSMVNPVETYRLLVRDVAEAELKTMADSAQAIDPINMTMRDGATEIEVSFTHQSEGFSRLVRAIIEHGGEILTCTSIAASFDDVFSMLIARNAESKKDTQ